MANRSRDIELKVFLSEEENELLLKKIERAGTRNKSAYVRKMILDGMIIKTDFKILKELSYEINKIGININQITKQLNEMQNICSEDIKNIKNMLQSINQKQKETLSLFISELR
ncbi:MAG: MobC family plasmid mobilization relaxosome protein [Clostridiaceae bacterium]|nr:MobC family plasmid mobilization relaxosome protein [Clostridiaceae bacterium]